MGIVAVERLAPETVLAELAACDHAEKAAAARRLELAAIWARLHPGVAEQPYDKVIDSLIDDATGASVAAIAEFAAVHGISTNAGRQLIADAITLRDRLPHSWERMTQLELPAWKARMLAQHAYRLGADATAWLDSNAAMLGGKLGVRTIKRFTLMAKARFEPDTLTDPDERRWVYTGAHPDELDGAGWVEGRLDTPDALDLEAALRLIAADLAAAGADDDVDVRRAQALGVMARRTLGQPELSGAENTRGTANTAGTDSAPRLPEAPNNWPSPSDANARAVSSGRPVTIYLHFDATQLDTCTGLGELGTTGQLVTIDQIRAWCGAAGTITIRPVIDLNSSRSTRSYQPTDVMREHLALRDQTCVFPHCTRTAHPVRQRGTGEYSHDADHITPHESGGETSTENLACLCRLHHLLKTHTGWRYQMLGPGEYLWKSPSGHQFLRTSNGTTMLTTPRAREGPAAA